MAAYNRICFFSFIALCLFKAVDVIQESPHSWYEAMPMALVFAAVFGSPQLASAIACRRAKFSSLQALIASSAVIAFIGTSLLFGSFPGAGRPYWGGEGHFEVPAALAVEWLVAGLLLLAFRSGRTEKRGMSS